MHITMVYYREIHYKLLVINNISKHRCHISYISYSTHYKFTILLNAKYFTSKYNPANLDREPLQIYLQSNFK